MTNEKWKMEKDDSHSIIVDLSQQARGVLGVNFRCALIACDPVPIIVGSMSCSGGENMSITKTDVETIADLARLELTADETELFAEQLSSIIRHVEKLNELDTTDVAPMSHCAPAGGDMEYAMRDDQARPSLGQKLAVENAPDSEVGYFKVPRVIGG